MRRKKEPKKPGQKGFLRRHKKAVIVIAIIVLLGGAIGACSLKLSSAATDAGATATVDEATVGDIKNTMSANGEIAPATEENIVPHAGWKFKEVLVKNGQAVKEGEALLKYTNGKTLNAPYNCVVEKFSLPNKDKTLTNDHYLKIGSTDTVAFELTAKESNLGYLSIGQEATVKTVSGDKKYTGRVTFISDMGKYSDSGSEFDVIITFPNDGTLKVGMSGKATILLQEAKGVVTVPLDAVQYKEDNNEGAYVTVVKKDGTTKDVDVETGIANKKKIEIKSGLKGGESIQYYPVDDGTMMYY